MSDKLCLQWNDFQKNVANAFRNLREDKEFADLTLVCEDGNQIEVHKVVLSSSSPFFKKLLAKNKHERVLGGNENQNDQLPKTKQISQVPLLKETSADNLPSTKPETEKKLIVPNNDVSSDLDELEARVMSMMQKSENRLSDTYGNRRAYICKECGKEGFVAAIKDHIESNHLEGIRLPCTHCGKIFRLLILTKSQHLNR